MLLIKMETKQNKDRKIYIYTVPREDWFLSRALIMLPTLCLGHLHLLMLTLLHSIVLIIDFATDSKYSIPCMLTNIQRIRNKVAEFINI